MNKKTDVELLDEAIEHWKDALRAARGKVTRADLDALGAFIALRDIGGVILDGSTCPLCKVYCPDYRASINLACEECPIAIYVGEMWCEETPYLDVIESKTKKALVNNIQKEIAFLKKVKAKAIVDGNKA